MIDTAAARLEHQERALGIRGPAAVDGERVALAVTAAAIALLPLLDPRGPANTAPVDALIALAVWTGALWVGTSGHRLRFPYAVPIGLFIAGGAVGALVGPVPGSGAVALLQDVMLIAWCWAVANVSSSARRLQVLLATWVYASIAWSLALFVGLATGTAVLTGRSEGEASRTALTFGDPSYSANYYFISIMLIWASGYPRHRGLRISAYALLVAALASTGSNSGIVSLVLGTSVAGLCGTYRRFGAIPALTATALVAFGGYFAATNISVPDLQARAHESRYAFVRDGVGRSSKSEELRSQLLEKSRELHKTGGPLGQGPVSTKARLEADMAPLAKEAHNDYFAALLERGALGLAGVLLLLAAIGRRVLTVTSASLGDGFGLVLRRPNALLGALAGLTAAMGVYELLHLRHLWALFAFIAAIAIWGRR
jgi:hypothetical protein